MVIEKVIVVEGRQDKLQLLPILAERVEIICTNGIFSLNRLEELIDPYEECALYAFFDADEMGGKLRQAFNRHYPEAHQLYTQAFYGAVEQTPRHYLAKVLRQAEFAVHEGYLLSKG